ncbi:MAG: hypothetical protein ACK4Y7_02210 [Caldimicrobium sp.]
MEYAVLANYFNPFKNSVNLSGLSKEIFKVEGFSLQENLRGDKSLRKLKLAATKKKENSKGFGSRRL